jgi:hypothetical protein
VINLDFSEILPPGLFEILTEELEERILDDLAAGARAKWIRLAQQELRSSKRDYINAIQDIESETGLRTIRLVGWLANAVEQGIDAWDLRLTLLNANARESKDGHRYRPIPFRHGTAGTQGEAGTPMGTRYGPQGAMSRAFAREGVMGGGEAASMGRAVHRAAKKLRGGQSLGDPTRVKMGRSMVQVPRLAPWHKTDLYAGMKRVEKTYGKATQAHYMTFRTISSRNTTGWIHPGIEARNLAERVEAHVEELVSGVIKQALSAAIGVE